MEKKWGSYSRPTPLFFKPKISDKNLDFIPKKLFPKTQPKKKDL